jgi:hypothetical protein
VTASIASQDADCVLTLCPVIGDEAARSPLCAAGESVAAAPPGWPLVVFGDSTCASAGASSAPSDLLALLKERRNLEATIRAVPGACPTATEVTNWVEQQGATNNVTMTNVPMGGARGRCYLPYVEWQTMPGYSLPWVEISPSQYPAATGTTVPSSPRPNATN